MIFRIRLVLLLVISFASPCLRAQSLTRENYRQLVQAESALKLTARKMVQDPNASVRFAADSAFIRGLVTALKTPGSFSYAFDSLETVSRLYSPDSLFRVFTWEFSRDENYFRQRGAIQMKTADGSLKLFPLIDMSDFTPNPFDSVRNNFNWIGAIYYRIVLKQYNGRKYYTLLGFDNHNIASSRKWADILTFPDGKPEFGGKLFNYPNDSLKPAQPAYRFCLEYSKEARARLNYDSTLGMLVFDHLISEKHNQADRSTLVPDGDYEGFKWNEGRWNYVEKVFNYSLQNGQAPTQNTLLDPLTGLPDQKKLDEQNRKNAEKEKKKKP